ncbi:hypothetical protein ABEF95_002028 [Exophiala dermatitidis]
MFVPLVLYTTFLFLLPQAIFSQAMAEYDPDISNGTCYYAFGEETTSRYSPCGNEALGNKACCESGDVCLSSNACYNGQYGVTYIAGCTDPYYEDPKCPDKGDFAGHPWAGLVYCNGTSNEWVACDDRGDAVSVPAPCWCPSTSRTVAFIDASVLDNIMSLPATQGQTVHWSDVAAYESEHSLASSMSSTAVSTTTDGTSSVTTSLSPTSTSSASPTASATSPSATNSSTVAPVTPTEPATPTRPPGLDTGQKVGIALGSAGGVLVLLLFGWLLIKKIRQRKVKERSGPPMIDVTSAQPHDPSTSADLRSSTWSGHKSELPADESIKGSPSPRYQDFRRPQSTEVEGSPVPRLSPSRVTQDGGYSVPGNKRTFYEMPG